MQSDNTYPLTHVPRLLRERFGVSVAYPRLWRLAVAGDIPAERIGRCWAIRDEDLPAVAAAVSASRAGR